MKKEKYLQIFNYLLEFSKLRSKSIRDIESADSQYPEIIWLANIPKCEIFDSILFDTYNQDADYLLKVSKPKFEPTPPSFPKINELLFEWIVEESLTDENGMPTLKENILKNGKEQSLSDHPRIVNAFQDYINNKWLDDLQIYQKDIENFKKVYADFDTQNKTYKRFFSVYNKAQQFGEEFELIMGIGLLYFKENDSAPLICRHILTSKVEISFEFSQRESFVKVSLGIENEIQIETDAILDLFEQFDSSNIIDAEKVTKDYIKDHNIGDNLFDSQIRDAIQLFADRLRPDSQSSDEINKPKITPKRPSIFYAPALILRKRNTRSFTALYGKIINDIENESDEFDIPTINDIIGIIENTDTDLQEGDDDIEMFSEQSDQIYFPKKYNDEQIEIIEKSRRNKKVLVQGPPGTGKSHTIANLICHLLANGKKVLVTAYTKRALEVLKNQIPQDFQNLTVNLLSGDSSSIKDLEASVNAINDELSKITNINSYKREIEEKELQLSILKEEKATTFNEWLKVKEKSTRIQDINKNYRGVLSEIAERIEKEELQFSWFKDNIINIERIELIPEVNEFFRQTQLYNKIDTTTFKLEVPKKEKIFSVNEIREYYRISVELQQKLLDKERYYEISCNNYSELRRSLENLLELLKEFENINLEFKERIILNLKNNLKVYENKITETRRILADLPFEELRNLDRSVLVKYPTTKNLIEIKSDAEFLLGLIQEGKRLTGILSVFNNPLASQSIKQRKYFHTAVQVNGKDCGTQSEIQTVLRDIKIKQAFEELDHLWEDDGLPICKSTYSEKARQYENIKNETEKLIEILGGVIKLKREIESISSFKISTFSSVDIKNYIDVTEYNEVLSQVKYYKGKISFINNYLSTVGLHPIAKNLLNALNASNVDTYENCLIEIDQVNEKLEQFKNYKRLQQKLTQHFPILLDEIVSNAVEKSSIDALEDAVCFKHAQNEILRLLAQDYEKKLTFSLFDYDNQEEKLISIIASKKAWLYVLEGLNKNFALRQHLQAWVQAIKKIGKTGTGKRALKFRKEAQQQMEKCKDSVPCWIMPLYKVAETINPEMGMYDYVIIDEASQLGAEAIFLLYISKNIIIVGDDKQTSPEYVGIDANTMNPHINRHLHDIPFANYYGTEFSFFDHAKRFCKGITVLREHFRCMPEIIEFCNSNFYAPEGMGLYPLKQYSETRVEPLKTVFCQNGYVEGSYQNITNRIEAEGISEKIYQLINDSRYNDKTIGVIALQGNAQAKLIEAKLIDKIGSEEIKKRKIICGNSASYQGDERDIMFLSLITAHNHNRSALTKPEDERRFNVAVSRAKEQVWLFHSVQLEDLSNIEDLRYKLLNHFLNYKPQSIPIQRLVERTTGSQPDPFESWFEVDVYNDIVAKNYSVIPQYEVAKGRYRIDLVTILSNGVKIAIECDGDKFHGAEQFQNDLMRQKVLERCGWQFFRIRGAEYYSNRKKTLEPLWEMLLKNDNGKTASNVTFTQQPNNEEQKISETQPSNEISINEQRTFTQSKNSAPPELFDDTKLKNPVDPKDAISQTERRIKSSSDLFSFTELLIFSSNQTVHKIQNDGYSDYTQVLNQIEFDLSENPIYITGTVTYTGFLIVAFKNGKIGKISMNSFKTEHNRRKLKNALNAESPLIFIEHIENDLDLIAVSSINKIILFNTNKINPVGSRMTKGVQVMKPKDGSFMLKVVRANQVILSDPEYYRKDGGLNIVGYYLKQGDEV
jgi:very-short-patch-repair endonuclease/cellulose biosynthesis protein BcsQ